MPNTREKPIELLTDVCAKGFFRFGKDVNTGEIGGYDMDASDIADYLLENDVVQIVRCKDCIGKAHWYKNDYGCTICGLSGLFVVEDMDFCSYGERRDGE